MTSVSGMEKTRLNSFEDKLIYITDHIVNQLNANKLLLQFISKNLSWGVFRSAIEKSAVNDDSEFLTAYKNILRASRERYRNPELMLFMPVPPSFVALPPIPMIKRRQPFSSASLMTSPTP